MFFIPLGVGTPLTKTQGKESEKSIRVIREKCEGEVEKQSGGREKESKGKEEEKSR